MHDKKNFCSKNVISLWMMIFDSIASCVGLNHRRIVLRYVLNIMFYAGGSIYAGLSPCTLVSGGVAERHYFYPRLRFQGSRGQGSRGQYLPRNKSDTSVGRQNNPFMSKI
jgi:hypothetical protein